MVSTRQAEKARKVVKGGSSPAHSGDEHEEPTPEPDRTRGTKRARTTKMTDDGKEQKKRRKKAKLSRLPEMPVDILYEVRGSHLYYSLVDTKKSPDLFSSPPERPNAYLLDGEVSQWVPHQQVIATCLAGLIQDNPEE
jgi:hypothetical protein